MRNFFFSIPISSLGDLAVHPIAHRQNGELRVIHKRCSCRENEFRIQRLITLASCLVRVCFSVFPIPCLVSDLVYNLVSDSIVSFRGLTFTWTLTWPRNSLFLRYWRFLKFPLAISMSPLSYLQRWVGHCFYCGGQVRLSLSTFRRSSVVNERLSATAILSGLSIICQSMNSMKTLKIRQISVFGRFSLSQA